MEKDQKVKVLLSDGKLSSNHKRNNASERAKQSHHTQPNDIPFEKAFTRLEEILERMNSGTISLDESLKLYEEADTLIATCSKRLTDAERKIEILIKNRNGDLTLGADQKPCSNYKILPIQTIIKRISMDEKLLPLINSPEDVKELSHPDLLKLSQEIRQRIIEILSINGGHLASNLGAVELTIALHKVFNSPEDKFIWDVSHQTYTHKF